MIEYREANRQDIPQLLELYKQLSLDDENPDLILQDIIWDKVETNDIKYFVAADNGKIVSTCFICIIPNLTWKGKSIGFIENVVTDEHYRQKGIGKKILEMAINHAKENDCYKVLLQSNYKRKEAHLFYEAIGFDGDSKRAFEIRWV